MTTEGVLRRGILALAWLTLLATAAELGLERHWKDDQLIAWVVTALATLAVVLVSVRPRRGSLWAARALAVAVLGASAFGVVEHVKANYEAGELDANYAARWPSMSESARWQAAALKSVGPAPILAAGALADVAVLVLLATMRHPGLGREAAEAGT